MLLGKKVLSVDLVQSYALSTITFTTLAASLYYPVFNAIYTTVFLLLFFFAFNILKSIGGFSRSSLTLRFYLVAISVMGFGFGAMAEPNFRQAVFNILRQLLFSIGFVGFTALNTFWPCAILFGFPILFPKLIRKSLIEETPWVKTPFAKNMKTAICFSENLSKGLLKEFPVLMPKVDRLTAFYWSREKNISTARSGMLLMYGWTLALASLGLGVILGVVYSAKSIILANTSNFVLAYLPLAFSIVLLERRDQTVSEIIAELLYDYRGPLYVTFLVSIYYSSFVWLSMTISNDWSPVYLIKNVVSILFVFVILWLNFDVFQRIVERQTTVSLLPQNVEFASLPLVIWIFVSGFQNISPLHQPLFIGIFWQIVVIVALLFIRRYSVKNPFTKKREKTAILLGSLVALTLILDLFRWHQITSAYLIFHTAFISFLVVLYLSIILVSTRMMRFDPSDIRTYSAPLEYFSGYMTPVLIAPVVAVIGVALMPSGSHLFVRFAYIILGLLPMVTAFCLFVGKTGLAEMASDTHPEGHSLLALSREAYDSDSVEENYIDAIDKNPSNGLVHFWYAKYLGRQNRKTEAEEHFIKAVNLSPDEGMLHNDFGVYLEAQGRLKEAYNEYEKAYNLDANEIVFCRNRAAVLELMGEKKRADKVYLKLIVQWPEAAESHFMYADFLDNQGRWHEAQHQYKVSIELLPDNATYHNDYGVLLEKMGNLDDAEDEYRVAVSIDKEKALYHSNLARILENKGVFNEAKVEYKKALDIEPTNEDYKLYYLDLLGKIK